MDDADIRSTIAVTVVVGTRFISVTNGVTDGVGETTFL